MVDREQEQARRFADSIGANGRAGADLAWIVAISAVVAAFAFLTGSVEKLLRWADGLSSTNLNGLLALLVLVPAGASIYAIRRYRDAAKAQGILRDLSYHDPLTHLPNRRFLGEGFDEMLRDARRYNGRVAVLFVDLDGFKKINDTYGHETGDRVMAAVADRLRGALGQNDRVVRYGGDEFVALCPDVTNAASAEKIARRIIKAIEEPFDVAEDKLKLSASVGVALTEERCTRPEEVLRDADAAMYQAKAKGAGTYALFDRSMRDQITPSTAERRLRQALENGEFRLYYQPIVSLWTKRLVGAEALLRWNDPSRGMVNPDEFLPALEETGLIVPIGNWVIDEVCRQSRTWQAMFPDRPALNIKLNVSARQLAQANFVDHLRECLTSSGADPDRICLEITEGALMYDVVSAWSTLRECKNLGVSLALDDFGTGYSSLSYLRQFSLDLLKIDKSFVDGLGQSREDTTIVEHVIGMAKALGIVTVAEGVENEEQVTQLRAMNCDLAQGYYFSHPQPPDVISHLLERNANKEEWRPPPKTDDAGEHLEAAPAVVIPEKAQPPSKIDADLSAVVVGDDEPAPLPRR
ncbi:MAG: bifunctional diguanylate cyclase/phosphodiesterase [Actinobacteria bacterium]|nr:bifunctional diguanylate cyclase/phosphodiesterase [Actinomycetota bacterium]